MRFDRFLCGKAVPGAQHDFALCFSFVDMGPSLIEFRLEAGANVLPIVPPGNALDEMEGI